MTLPLVPDGVKLVPMQEVAFEADQMSVDDWPGVIAVAEGTK